jgi:hypothetical protein
MRRLSEFVAYFNCMRFGEFVGADLRVCPV